MIVIFLALCGADWPTYLFSIARGGFNQGETLTNVNPLIKAWNSTQISAGITTQPIVYMPTGANTMVYFGGMDGYERAYDAVKQSQVWADNLGTETGCTDVPVAGVGDTGTVVSSVSGLSSDPVLFVGGNDPNVSPSQSTPIFYAIDALTGDVLWHTKANQLAPVGSYDWSSPAVYTPTGATDPRIYVGLASVNDCPLVQGKLFQLDARTGPCRYLQYGA